MSDFSHLLRRDKTIGQKIGELMVMQRTGLGSSSKEVNCVMPTLTSCFAEFSHTPFAHFQEDTRVFRTKFGFYMSF